MSLAGRVGVSVLAGGAALLLIRRVLRRSSATWPGCEAITKLGDAGGVVGKWLAQLRNAQQGTVCELMATVDTLTADDMSLLPTLVRRMRCCPALVVVIIPPLW